MRHQLIPPTNKCMCVQIIPNWHERNKTAIAVSVIYNSGADRRTIKTCANSTKSKQASSSQQRSMQREVCHKDPIPSNVRHGTNNQHIHRLPALPHECRQNSERWHDINLHLWRCHCAQGTKCTHHMQGRTHPHRHWRQARTVLYPIGSTTRTMVTTLPIEESANSTVTSKQRLWSPFNGASGKMDVCSMRIPSQVHMAESNQSKKLCWVAGTNQAQR